MTQRRSSYVRRALFAAVAVTLVGLTFGLPASGQQKGEGEAVASQHASSRVAQQMDAEGGRLIREKNADYQNKFRNPLLRKGEFPEELNFSTTRNRVQVRMLQESSAMVGAPDDPPGFAKDYDLAARARAAENLVHVMRPGDTR